MAKTRISEYDSTASNNTDVDGVNIAESCPPSGINNAIREVMAHLKDFQSGTSGDTLPLTAGGTGATTASGVRTVLGLGALALLDTVDTAQIDADAITNAKIADDSIDSEHYVDGSIDTVHIGDSQITSAKIANNNVTADELNVSGDGTVGQALLSDGDGSFSWGDSGITQTTGSAPYYACRAFGFINGWTTASLINGQNIASVSRSATGKYTVTFTTAMPDANYTVLVFPDVSSPSWSNNEAYVAHGVVSAKSTTSFDIWGQHPGIGIRDLYRFSVVVFR